MNLLDEKALLEVTISQKHKDYNCLKGELNDTKSAIDYFRNELKREDLIEEVRKNCAMRLKCLRADYKRVIPIVAFAKKEFRLAQRNYTRFIILNK